MSLILSSAEVYVENPLWWCMVAVLMCIEHIARKEAAHEARVECLDALLDAKHQLDAMAAELATARKNNTDTDTLTAKDTL